MQLYIDKIHSMKWEDCVRDRFIYIIVIIIPPHGQLHDNFGGFIPLSGGQMQEAYYGWSPH